MLNQNILLLFSLDENLIPAQMYELKEVVFPQPFDAQPAMQINKIITLNGAINSLLCFPFQYKQSYSLGGDNQDKAGPQKIIQTYTQIWMVLQCGCLAQETVREIACEAHLGPHQSRPRWGIKRSRLDHPMYKFSSQPQHPNPLICGP